jgi:hypothetical protein
MLDGLITFFASHHAIRAEKVLGRVDLSVELVPGPKELSPNCGVALRIEYDRRDVAAATLTEENVQVDEIIRYQPRTDSWNPEPVKRRPSRFLRRS